MKGRPCRSTRLFCCRLSITNATMSLMLVGSLTLTGILAFMCCSGMVKPRRQTDLSTILINSSVAKLNSSQELSALIAKGGKAVVYLTASW